LTPAVSCSVRVRPPRGTVAALADRLRWPSYRYHRDVSERFPKVRGHAQASLQRRLEEDSPDFLFVSPQLNPVALALRTAAVRTRLILATYDVEAVRVRRLGTKVEARRAARFERDNLAHYDGVIAVRELDKGVFVGDYGWAAERVLVLENGVDQGHFVFTERRAADAPAILFVGSLGYPPNAEAASRLLHGVMPIVWLQRPEARLWIVGQSPARALTERSDGDRIVVTGKVDDVRPYLAQAAVGCVPLSRGAGTKDKVLEALRAGPPLACSPAALEGLALHHGEHVTLAESDEELARAIVAMLERPEEAAAQARRGRKRIEEHYSWNRILPRLDGWLDTIAALPKRMP